MGHNVFALQSTVQGHKPQLSFVVGKDYRGRWVAVETHGHGGGIFCNRQAAMRYAAAESDWRPNAVKCVGSKVLLAF